MPMTNAERQKKFRERQLLNNREEYLHTQSQYKKKQYRKKYKDGELDENEDENEIKEEDEIEDEEEFVLLKPLKRRPVHLNKKIINDDTKKTYIRSLSKIYNSYYHKQITDEFKEELIKLLSMKKYNIKLIKEEFKIIDKDIYDIIKNTSNRADIRNLNSIVSKIRGFTNLIKKITPYTNKNQQQYIDNRAKKKFTPAIKRKYDALSFNKDDIIKNLNNDDLELTSKEKLLYGLFTLFHTRRPVDYNRMIIPNEKPKYENRKKIKDRNNYYFDGVFYFYITKNKQIQKYNVPHELRLLIENEINSRNDIEEENKKYFLLNNDNKPYKYSSYLSCDIMLVYKKIYKISISAVEIRRFYCTNLKYKVINGEMTEEKHREIAEMMNHSYEESLDYAYDII